jgi:hypothetical protein
VITTDLSHKLLAMETIQFNSWWSAVRSSLGGIMEHVTSLPNSTHWRSLARRSTADSTHVLPGSNRSIDARSIVTLIFFFLISTSTFLSLGKEILIIDILVIWPIHIPLPLFLTHLRNRFLPSTPSVDAEKPEEKEKAGRMYFKLGLETAPVIGVLVLLASTCIPGSVVRDGIVGSEGVRPYDIMTLFLSFVSLSFNRLCTSALVMTMISWSASSSP